LLIIKMERFMILPPPEAFAGKLSTTDSRTERACRRPKSLQVIVKMMKFP
jgi:hypothetical protein